MSISGIIIEIHDFNCCHCARVFLLLLSSSSSSSSCCVLFCFRVSGACIIQSFGQLFNYSAIHSFIHSDNSFIFLLCSPSPRVLGRRKYTILYYYTIYIYIWPYMAGIQSHITDFDITSRGAESQLDFDTVRLKS